MATFAYSAILALLATTVLSQSQQIDVMIDPPVRELRVAAGGSQVLKCSVTLIQNQAQLKWVKDGEDLVSQTQTVHDGDFFIIQRILTLTNFQESDAGAYDCFYKSGQSDESRSTINLFAIAENKTHPVYYYGNTTGRLECNINATGSSQATYTSMRWLKWNVPVLDGDDEDKYEVTDSNMLIIKKLNRDDAGEYTAEFFQGDTSFYNCSISYTAGPLVLDLDKSKNIIEGDDLEIACVVKGYPRPVVTWLRDNQNISLEDSRITLSEHEDVKDAKLQIKSLKPSDAGTYRCVAYSSLFGESEDAEIVVRYVDKLAWLYPLIGIIIEVVLLILIILFCDKCKQREKNSSDGDFTPISNPEKAKHRVLKKDK